MKQQDRRTNIPSLDPTPFLPQSLKTFLLSPQSLAQTHRPWSGFPGPSLPPSTHPLTRAAFWISAYIQAQGQEMPWAALDSTAGGPKPPMNSSPLFP